MPWVQEALCMMNECWDKASDSRLTTQSPGWSSVLCRFSAMPVTFFSPISKISSKSSGIFSSLPDWTAQRICDECMSDVHTWQLKKWGEEIWISRLCDQRAKIISWEAVNWGQGIEKSDSCGYSHTTVLLSSCQWDETIAHPHDRRIKDNEIWLT